MEKIENSIVTIVSYDAGGAELLSWWVKNNNQNKFYYFIKGPAKKKFF